MQKQEKLSEWIIGKIYINQKQMDEREKVDKHRTIVTELIYFWTLSKNRLTFVTGK